MKYNTEKKYIIEKILNHNAILCYEAARKKDFILLGKAVGFQKKPGDYADLDSVTKIYEIRDKSNLSMYERLMSSCNDEIISISEEIISRLEKRFGKNYHEKLHISLADHLKFSVYRYKNNIPVENIFLDEISFMYSEEYEFSLDMVKYVNKTLDIHLPDAEAAFICLHVHSALHNDNLSNSALYVNIISKSLMFIEDKTKIKLKNQSLEKQRLITHLKFAFKRAKKQAFTNNPITESIKKTYPATYKLAASLAAMLKEEFGIELPEGEIGYLALHIQNIIISDNNLLS